MLLWKLIATAGVQGVDAGFCNILSTCVGWIKLPSQGTEDELQAMK